MEYRTIWGVVYFLHLASYSNMNISIIFLIVAIITSEHNVYMYMTMYMHACIIGIYMHGGHVYAHHHALIHAYIHNLCIYMHACIYMHDGP